MAFDIGFLSGLTMEAFNSVPNFVKKQIGVPTSVSQGPAVLSPGVLDVLSGKALVANINAPPSASAGPVIPPQKPAPSVAAATPTAPAVDIAALFPPTAGGGDQAVGFGFPLLEATTKLILAANAERRAAVQQAVDVARLMSDLERVSPTRAAAMATYLGIPQKIDLSFANLFGQGITPPVSGGAGAGGLPGTLSGQQLGFLGANPNVAKIIADIADALGNPDIIPRSLSARIPFSPSLLGIAA